MTVTLTYDLDLHLQFPASYTVMTYLHANVQGQRSFGSEDRVDTNGRTDGQTDKRTVGGDSITSHANAVSKKNYVPHNTIITSTTLGASSVCNFARPFVCLFVKRVTQKVSSGFSWNLSLCGIGILWTRGPGPGLGKR